MICRRRFERIANGEFFDNRDEGRTQKTRSGLIDAVKKVNFTRRHVAVRHDLLRVYLKHRPDSLTTTASTVCRIERERTRLQRRYVDAAINAGHFFGIEFFIAVDDRNQHSAVSKFEGRFHRFGEAFADTVFHQQTINDDFDRVVPTFVEDDLFVKLPHFAVDTRAQKAVFV